MRALFLLFGLFGTLFATNEDFVNKLNLDSPVWASGRFTNIDSYSDGFAKLFVYLQGNDYFAMGAAIGIFGVILAFAFHYIIVGPKKFSHDHGKVYAFSAFERIIHLIAAISWTILVPTGVIMMFGATFGGGFFVRLCKNLHGLATISFAISLFPMLSFWFVRMLPRVYDIRWMFMVGGYLSKNKKPIPAGKFNAGQKAWFWVCTIGGLIMVISGAMMFFLDHYTPAFIREFFGISQIELLRAAALIHNILGIVCAIFLLVHIYMAVFAIKGAIHSIITGYKEEEEVYILHHYWYQELVRKGKIKPSIFEKQYLNLK